MAQRVAERITDCHQLFIGALPQDITEEELSIVFSTYGEVRSIKVLTNPSVSRAGSAFVFYETSEAAEDAITVLHEQYMIRDNSDRPIRVSWAQAGKGGKGGDKGKGDKGGDKYTRGKGKSFPALGDDGKHAACGKGREEWVSDQRVKGWQGSAGGDGGWGGDWGDGWRQPDWWGGSWSDSWHDGGRGWTGRGSGKGNGSGKDYKGKDSKGTDGGKRAEGDDPCRLYVGNLPSDISEEALDYVFKTYGSVESIHIIKGRKVDADRICAIIVFNEADEAATAIRTLDKVYEIRLGQGPIEVRVANNSKNHKARMVPH